ncbi:MAG: phosphonate C-P lyase system protein PhnH, partial [Pseudomonadota bacterium]
MGANTLLAGLEKPVENSQFLFRQILKAMSQPGLIIAFDDDNPSENTLINHVVWKLCCTLLDAECATYISSAVSSDIESVKRSLLFHTACKLTDSQKQADFALLAPAQLRDLSAFNMGTLESPHTSTTVLAPVDAISN